MGLLAPVLLGARRHGATNDVDVHPDVGLPRLVRMAVRSIPAGHKVVLASLGVPVATGDIRLNVRALVLLGVPKEAGVDC